MFKNPKNAFWQALFLTTIIFLSGLFLGLAYEESRTQEINKYYIQSETSLMDMVALSNLIKLNNISCEILVKSNIDLANKIYEEAYLLEKYEQAGKITKNLKLAHKKYDLLRTFLWINSIKTFEKCESDFEIVIYLYEYETKDLVKKATQEVWSKILFDLKKEKGNQILLIPIAVDNDLISLNSLIEKYNLSEFPVILINNKKKITELKSIQDLITHMN